VAQQHGISNQDVRSTGGQAGLIASSPLRGREEDVLDKTQVSSPGRDAARRFRQNWAAVVSLSTIAIILLVALLAPFLHTSNPLQPDYGVLNVGPSPQHWFGTDAVGRDLYSRLIFGLRVPLFVGFLGTFITVILGAVIGVVSGYAGGAVDSLLSRFTDVIFAFPSFLLSLISVSLFGQALDFLPGGSGRVILLTIVFAVVSWPGLMRFVRSLALGLKEQQFVEAARTSGSTSWKIVRRHLLPNMWGLVLVQASFIVVGVIYNEAILSIFGLGVPAPNPDLGRMLFDGTAVMDINAWEVVFPSGLFTIMILAFTFLGDGLRDAIDPRMNA
jgi:peptide/nickel transport system permease protein